MSVIASIYSLALSTKAFRLSRSVTCPGGRSRVRGSARKDNQSQDRNNHPQVRRHVISICVLQGELLSSVNAANTGQSTFLIGHDFATGSSHDLGTDY